MAYKVGRRINMRKNEAKIIKDKINYIMTITKEDNIKQELEDILSMITDLVKSSGWIPVTERLPECDEEYGISRVVWCLDAYKKTGFGIYQKHLRQEGWFTGGGVGENSIKITHWMPLPKLPERGE